ncbi:MAG: hypothetical protein WCK02_16680 [Bacteroidota bacterium]
MLAFLEILKYILPSGVVLATAYFLLKMFFDQEKMRKGVDIKIKSQRVTLPIRLQAYERIVLFLERISPDNLVMRLANPRYTAQQMQMELISAVRSEFEHNMSQQLYVSDEAWTLVKNAKEEVIKLINTSLGQLNDNATAHELSAKVIEMYASIPNFPTNIAMEFAKQEIRRVF